MRVTPARLTDEQAAAVARREGPLLLSAAAGSGKTTVLVERFVRMAVDDGIAPGRILVITFTERAAGELRARIRRGLLDRGERRLAQDAEGAWISTFHGFCARVLRAHAVAAGLDPAFAVLDEPAARALRAEAFERAAAGLLGPPGEPPRRAALDLVAAYGLDRLERTVLDVHAQLRSAGRERPRLPARPAAPDPVPLRAALDRARAAALACLEGLDGKRVGDARAAIERGAVFKPGNTRALEHPDCAAYLQAAAAHATAVTEAEGVAALELIDELLAGYGDAYAAAKRGRSAVDFDDLELLVARLLDEHPPLAAAWRARFERIMVDEFQDTNALQVGLLERLDAGHTFRVGDELQSIYGFRHASVEVFRATREALAARDAVALLTRNFRTHAAILERINAASAQLHDPFDALVAGREDPPADGPLVELLVVHAENGGWEGAAELGERLPGGPAWRWAEARLLAQRIAELVDSGAHRPGEVVVLVRAATDLACYERALEDAGLATLAAGGRGFWARQQVQDLTQYLAALANPRDEPALLGVLASPLGPQLGADELAALAVESRRTGHGLWAAVQAAGDERVAGWRAAFLAERAGAPRRPLADLLTRAIRASGYEEHVLGLPGGARRLANVRKLVRLAADYERQEGRGVRGFIDRATAELEAEAREADAPVELAGQDAVRLMTIHAAKGLEFPVVAVADLGRDPNVQTPDVLVDGDRVGLRVVTLRSRGRTAEHERLAAERLAREREESLRVFHVAVTRAQRRLLLSGAVNVERWPGSEHCAPAAWLLPAFGFPDHPDVRITVARPGDGSIRAAASSTAPADAGGGVAAVHAPPADPPPAAAPDGLPPAGPPGAPAPAAAPSGPPGAPAPAVPAPPAVPVSALSYSALSRYAQCGYRFYLERVLRLPEQDAPPAEGRAPAGGLDPLTRGSIAHELLERLEAPDAAAVRAQAALHGAELTEDDVADLLALVRAGLGSDVMQRVLAAPERHAEETFALALRAPEHAHVPLFTGVVDLRAVEADGGALIVDHKTDRLGDADPEEVVAAGYGVQRRLYALAALRAGAPHVEVAHLFLERPDAPAVARYAAADADRLEHEIAAQAAGVLAGAFPVAELPHRELCATCPGRGGLCSWPEEAALAPLPASSDA